MPAFKFIVVCMLLLDVCSCTTIKLPVTNQYALNSFFHENNHLKYTRKPSLLVSVPEATAGYQTEQMLYIKKPFKLDVFAKNAWVGPPATMLFPLLVQTLQDSGAFSAIASSPFADQVNYRLDTQLIRLHQTFISKPSAVELTVKIVVTRVTTNEVLASTLLSERVPCDDDTPYSGVVAANRATQRLTEKIQKFVILHTQQDKYQKTMTACVDYPSQNNKMTVKLDAQVK